MNLGWKRAIAIGVVAAVLAACTPDAAAPTTSVAAPPTTAPESSTTTTFVITRSPNIELGEHGIAVDIASVAYYDHATWVDFQSMLFQFAAGRSRAVEMCLERNAVSLFRAFGRFDHTDPYYMSKTWLPNVPLLLEHGFPDLSLVSDAYRGTEPRPDPDAQRVLDLCVDAGSGRDMSHYDLWTNVWVKWRHVQESIDGSSEVKEELDRFSQCLEAEGIPFFRRPIDGQPNLPPTSITEQDYVDYVDSLMVPGTTHEQRATILRDHGILYAECGQDLWATRERLLLEQRDDFLAENLEDLLKVQEFLYGPPQND